jgi:hypothetical protein
VKSLEAALWAFHHTDSFRDGCLLAVNLGDDADTTPFTSREASAAGQLKYKLQHEVGLLKLFVGLDTAAIGALMYGYEHLLVIESLGAIGAPRYRRMRIVISSLWWAPWENSSTAFRMDACKPSTEAPEFSITVSRSRSLPNWFPCKSMASVMPSV